MLISVSQHIQYDGCSLYAAKNKAFLTFPTFFIDINNGTELTVQIQPTDTSLPLSFDEITATLSLQVPPLPSENLAKSTPRNHLCQINEGGDFIQIDKTRSPLRVCARRVHIPFPQALETPLQDPATVSTSQPTPLSDTMKHPFQKHPTNPGLHTTLNSTLTPLPPSEPSPAIQVLHTPDTAAGPPQTESPIRHIPS